MGKASNYKEEWNSNIAVLFCVIFWRGVPMIRLIHLVLYMFFYLMNALPPCCWEKKWTWEYASSFYLFNFLLILSSIRLSLRKFKFAPSTKVGFFGKTKNELKIFNKSKNQVIQTNSEVGWWGTMDGAYGVLFWIMHFEINFLTCIWKDASFASNVDSYTKGQDIKKVEM